MNANSFPSPQTSHPGPCVHMHSESDCLSVTPSDRGDFSTIAESKSEPICFSLETGVFFSSLPLRTRLPLSDVYNP
jgi:hypothetical protein